MKYLPALIVAVLFAVLLFGGPTVTNLMKSPEATPSPDPLSDYDRGFGRGQEIGFKDGIFWGALAIMEGATNLNDAETRAYQMRREADARVKEHQKELNSINP